MPDFQEAYVGIFKSDLSLAKSKLWYGFISSCLMMFYFSVPRTRDLVARPGPNTRLRDLEHKVFEKLSEMLQMANSPVPGRDHSWRALAAELRKSNC